MDDLTGIKQAGVRATPVAAPADLKEMVGRTEDVPRGILMMIVATILFAAASAASKWLVAIYPVGEVLFLRSLSSFIACAAVMLPVTGLSVYATRRPRDHSRAACRNRSRSLPAPGLQPDAARRRGRHQFLRAAVCGCGVDRLAQGARRLCARRRAPHRLFRRAGRDQSRREFADAGRAVRAHQRGHVRHRHGRGARHDENGIGQYAGDLAS